MDAGDSFLLVNQKLDDHLWVIVSDPKKDSTKVLIVSLTTAAPHKESVCLIHTGEHSWVTHESCVAYNYAQIVTSPIYIVGRTPDISRCTIHFPLICSSAFGRNPLNPWTLFWSTRSCWPTKGNRWRLGRQGVTRPWERRSKYRAAPTCST
jgi:hypothetical protein